MKVNEEVNAIINDPALNYYQKCQALVKIRLNKRSGSIAATNDISRFLSLDERHPAVSESVCQYARRTLFHPLRGKTCWMKKYEDDRPTLSTLTRWQRYLETRFAEALSTTIHYGMFLGGYLTDETISTLCREVFPGFIWRESAKSWRPTSQQTVAFRRIIALMRLSPYITLEPVVEHLGLYKRYLRNQFIGYVAQDVDTGLCYHDEDDDLALRGLLRKLHKRTEQIVEDNHPLTMESVHERYGFCYDGIKLFARLNELNVQASYTRHELRDIIKNNLRANVEHFYTELRQCGLMTKQEARRR